MGNRALISVKGKPMLATHWDGCPESLGVDLLNSDRKISSLIAIACSHGLDAAALSLLTVINGTSSKALGNQHKLRSNTIFCHRLGDYLFDTGRFTICAMGQYSDWADWQYDIQDDRVLFRPLAGAYPASLRTAGAWQELTPGQNMASGDEQ